MFDHSMSLRLQRQPWHSKNTSFYSSRSDRCNALATCSCLRPNIIFLPKLQAGIRGSYLPVEHWLKAGKARHPSLDDKRCATGDRKGRWLRRVRHERLKQYDPLPHAHEPYVHEKASKLHSLPSLSYFYEGSTCVKIVFVNNVQKFIDHFLSRL